MTRLSSDEPAPGDQLPQGASRPARARTTDLSPGIVDVSGESLSAFASERELPPWQPSPVTRDSPRPRSAPVPPGSAAPAAGPTRVNPPRIFQVLADARWSSAVSILTAVVVAETVLLGWLWFSGGHWPRTGSGKSAVTITSDPGGSVVLVDGRAQGATPVTLALAAGSHQLQVGTEGSAWTQMLDVKAGQASALHVVQTGAAVSRETPERGTLEVTTEPAGLPVAIDRRPAGVSPISVGDLQPGSHEVTVTRGTAVIRRTVSVDAGVPTAVLIATATPNRASSPTASAAASPALESGWLTVAAPVPVRIFERGTLIGTSETPRLLLTVGRHDLEFVNETFGYRVLRTVQIAAGSGASASLEPATGTLSVNAQPWAEVWVDGQRIGETPIGNLSLAIGNHDLMLRHPQLGERRQTVAVSANTPARIGIDLRH